jgi:excisionase family DNA binding protein
MSVDPLELLTVAEVAELLKLDRGTVRKMVAAGELPGGLKFGRIWRVSRAELELELARRSLRDEVPA